MKHLTLDNENVVMDFFRDPNNKVLAFPEGGELLKTFISINDEKQWDDDVESFSWDQAAYECTMYTTSNFITKGLTSITFGGLPIMKDSGKIATAGLTDLIFFILSDDNKTKFFE